MGKDTPIELTKIKKIVADIQDFPAKIDSAEQAKNARHLLKKYAVLSEKIERNLLIRTAHQKDLIKIRTAEFKKIRHQLKEKANSILQAKNNKNVPSEKLTKTPTKVTTPKKTSKVIEEKEKDSKKIVKKLSSKPQKAAASKAGT